MKLSEKSHERANLLAIRRLIPDKVVDELKQYDFEIISTNLPEEQEQKLREAFAQE